MLGLIWFTFLYQPLFNALIWIYSNVANQNFGWAVIWLTIFLRIALLPFTIISERNATLQRKVEEEAGAAADIFKNDPIAQKEEARRIMKKYHVSPWAKIVTLFIQALVLVLLYQVFIRGISGEKVVKILYPGVDFPGKINTVFYGFEIGRTHDVLWAGLAAAYLLGSIIVEKRQSASWQKSELYFLIFFPLFTFAVLWYLPMVKSLFILTTMIFSDIIGLLHNLFFSSKKQTVN